MEKIQILFPRPVLLSLRALSERSDRPISEIIRLAVDRYLAQLPTVSPVETTKKFKTKKSGTVLVPAGKLKDALYE